jgi:hypothetical protein
VFFGAGYVLVSVLAYLSTGGICAIIKRTLMLGPSHTVHVTRAAMLEFTAIKMIGKTTHGLRTFDHGSALETAVPMLKVPAHKRKAPVC